MTDAHCHPFNLLAYLPGAEEDLKRRSVPARHDVLCGYDVSCAASSWNREQFEYHEELSKKAAAFGRGGPRVVPCFGIHPQLPADKDLYAKLKTELLELLEALPKAGRLGAVGETGFDLYGEEHKETEKVQDELFAAHLETALKYGLPVVIHARRAMRKVFSFSGALKKLPAVIFHSWPGTLAEGEALIRRGVNVFFSFGAAIINNHREAMRCAARLPVSRILLETDAPYQPPRGKRFSSWEDLALICERAAALRREAGDGETAAELERITDANFRRAFLGAAETDEGP